MNFDLRTISLGAGVQSTTLYLLSVHEEIHRADVAIFADTQSEPPWVYDHLDWLEQEFGSIIPIHRVTAGNLGEAVLKSQDGISRFSSVPFWVMGDDGRGAPCRRQCTREYKIDVVKREVRRLLGLKPRQRAKGKFLVEEMVGISTDEAHRAKPSRTEWIKTSWPLLFDQPMSRGECLAWMERHGYPLPRKSSCTFCPFHGNDFWRDMKSASPELFEEAVAFDKALRAAPLRGLRKAPYVHRSLVPLGEVDLSQPQMDLWANECEGMCGV